MPIVSPTTISECSLTFVRSLALAGLCDDKVSSPASYNGSLFRSRQTVNHIEMEDDLRVNEHLEHSNQVSYVTAGIDPYDPFNDDKDTYNITQSAETNRKRSGEIVKSSMKNGRLGKRAISLPSTPPCSKEVHFDVQLERVRYFFHSEKPAAISHEASPIDEYPSTSSPFPEIGEKYHIEVLPFTCTSEFPVHLEIVYLSSETATLVGQILVRNLEFQKEVAVRFTFNNWQTISEIRAFYHPEHNDETNPRTQGFDRFTFNIAIRYFIDVDSESPSLFFCLRYNVAGQEFWDNNSGQNYRVNFHKRDCELQPLRRIKSCPSILNTQSVVPSLHSFFNLFKDHLEDMTDFDDTELWAASYKSHAI